MTYEEYKKQRLAQNNTQSNVSNTTEINTAPVNRYEEYKKQRLAQQQDYSKTLEKETKQAQLAKDFISQNGTEKINSEYNNYMQSMNKAIAPKLYQTEGMQELASKRNATTPLEVSVYAKGNPVTQSILKLQNFAKENGIEIDVNDPVTSLTNQTNKLDDAKKEELMKYIYTYNKVRQEDLKNKNYIGNRAVSGLVSSISGAIDAGLGFLAENPLNRAMRSKNELYANIQKKVVNEDSPLYQPLNQMADKTLQKVEEERDKVTARANKLKEYNILGTTAEALKKEQQGIEETQNISSLKKFTGDITEGITGMAPTILLSAYTQNPQLGLNVMSTSAGGNAYREALNEGQSSDNAIAYGTLMGLKEYATEKMFGAMNRMAGFDVKGYGDELSESIINQIFKENSNKILRGFAEYTLGGVEEGLEEFVGDLVEPYIKNLTLGTKEKADLKSALYSGLVGAMTGLAMGAPGGAINLANDIKTNQSTTQNNTQLPQNTQNTSNNVQNVANSEQISQNNVQNVSDLEKNQQMSISDEQNSQATVTNEIQTFVENRNKIAPGLNVEMDNTLKTDGVIIKNSDGTRTMKINPNSTRAYEFVAVHEMLHDLEGTQEYSELQKYVQDRATSHENYEQAKQKITEQYENFYKENNLDISKLDMNVETVNDMVAQSLGNQQFLNELAGNKPNVFMKMYNWVKNVLFDGQNTGKTFNERRTDNKHLQELKKKFEVAYNTAYNGNASQQYSIQTDTNGNKYVKVDTDQDIFKNIDKKDYNKIAKMYIQDYLMGKTKLSNNDTTVIDRKSANKYTNPGKKQQNFNEKMQLTPELKNVLEIAQKDSTSRPLKSNSKYKNWEYYKVKFEINGKMFEGLINIGLDSNNNKHFYEINKIRETDDISRTSLNSSSTSLFKYSIPSSDGTVNNQYMQNNEKNSQGLENSSSFSLSKDNQGRTLSKEQQEYFKDSKVRDENGNLLVVYHGTQNGGFTEFHGYSYFTDSPDTARSYSGGIENITKYTFESGQRTTTGNYKGYLNLINPYIIDLKGAEWGEINIDSLNIPEIQQWINEVGVSTWNDNGKTFISTDDIVSIVDAMNDSGKNYDGIILKNIRDNGMRANTNDNISTDYVAFKGKEQFKSIDNTKPTSNPDIRYSQSNNEWSKYLKENWDLMPNSKKTFGFPTNEQLQAMDNKKIFENADTLNLKEIKRPQKEETYKTNLERSSGLIEQKIEAIEEGKIKRDENAKRVSKEDIRKTIENSINQKLFTKHFREKAYGIYKPSTDTIRLAQRSDFETAIHELGHQIDIKQLDNLSRNADIKVKAELRMLCEKSFPGTYKEIRTQLEEGFAEATRNFIIDSKSFAADYPNTAYLIQNELEKSPQLNKLFNTLQEQIHDYINMTPKDRVLSNVSFEGEEQKPKLTKEYIKDKVIEWVWDDTIPLKRLVEKIAKTKNVKVDNLSPSENIAMSLKLAEGLGDATVSSLRNGYEENGVKQTKGFSEILKDFDHNDIEDLVAYMVSEGNLDYIKANKQTGIRESDAKAVLKKYKDTKISKASAEIREINDYSLKRLLQSGLITKEQVKSFKKVNEHYVPMNRVIDIEGKIGLNAKGLQNGKVIKGRKGSDRMIINPLESTVVNNMRIDRQIANNENLKNLVDTLKQNDLLGEYIDEIPTPMQFKGSATLENFKGALEKQGVDTTELDLEAVYNIFTPKLSDDKNLIMSYMEKGKRKYIQFKDKSLYNVVNGLTGQKGLNGIQKFYSYFNGALRWGATAGNIDFSLPNTISDSQTAFLNSDATFIPIVDSIIGVADAVAGNTAEHSKLSKLVEKIAPDYQKRKARLYELYEKSGAKSTTNRSGLKRSNNLDNVLGALALDEKTLLGKDKARPIRAIKKATEWAPALSEEATRFRNFEKEVKLYQKQGMKLEDAVKKAGYNAKRVTQDFSQSGKATRVVNSVIPFTSARIGGTYQAYENFAKNPKRYSTRLALLTASSAVIHALLIQALKNGTRKDEEEYKELQDQKLLDNYTFPIGDGKTITIKKIQGPVRAIINLTEMAVDYSMGMIDDKGLDKRLKAIANDVKMDNSYLGKPTDVAGQFGTPILENALNKDFYYGNDLVPENMKYLDNANKYDENTTETAKLIGKALNYPPIYIDNLVEGYLAGIGTQTMQVSDWVINKVTGKKSAKRQASESFITKRFIADDYKNSQSVSEIYDTYDELKNDEAEGRLTEEQKKQLENIEQAKDTMAIINKKIREAKTDNALNSKEKAEKIRELQKQRTDTARYYLGKETITKENKEQIELYEYYPTATSKISRIIDEEEKNEYAQIVKDTYAFNLKSLEDNKEYIKANEEEKISMEKTALTQAKNTAKEKMIQNNLEELVEEHGEEETATSILNAEQLKQYEKVEKAGIPLVDYYNAWLAQKNAEGKKNAKIKAINSAVDDDLTTYQKKTLYRIFNVD